MERSFHGRTLATLTATAQEKYHKGYAPLVPGFKYVPFNDIEAVRKAIDSKTCAILIEPIQGEGGVNIPSEGYLKALREICDENRILLIFDEVQVGMGRTGKLFAYEHYGIEPDLLTLAKSLAGGVPIGALLMKKEMAEGFKPGDHASTFGGNPLATAAGVAALTALLEEGIAGELPESRRLLFDPTERAAGSISFCSGGSWKGVDPGHGAEEGGSAHCERDDGEGISDQLHHGKRPSISSSPDCDEGRSGPVDRGAGRNHEKDMSSEFRVRKLEQSAIESQPPCSKAG